MDYELCNLMVQKYIIYFRLNQYNHNTDEIIYNNNGDGLFQKLKSNLELGPNT